MNLDQYQLCPCGSGKKIKFCCSREYIHDLDRILRMVKGDQRLAALEKIEGLLAKYPDRPALLMTKADIEIQLHEPDKARQSVLKLLEIDSSNPSALATRAMLDVSLEGNLNAGINGMQDALEAADTTVTPRMYEAILVLAEMLVHAGLPAASKGHLMLALRFTNGKDERSASAMVQLNQSHRFPLVLRESINLCECPENVTWKIEFDNAMRDIYNGRWRAGAAQLSAMSARILDAPPILFNQAIAYIWLGDNLNAVKSLQDFALIRDVPTDDRVHALALAESLDPDLTKKAVELIDRTYEVGEIDSVMEKCLSHHRLTPLNIHPDAAKGDEPLPRAIFDVLDKSQITDFDNVSVTDIPASLGNLLVYGRETDRPARIVLHVSRGHADEVLELCKSLINEPLGDPTSEKHVDWESLLTADILRAWKIPAQVPIDERRRLNVQLRRHAMTHDWPDKPSPRFDGKTPTEAAQDNRYKLALLANLLNLETLAQDSHWDLDFNDIRRQLGLPEREPIDAATVDLARLPASRLGQLKIQELNDDDLIMVYRRAYSVMAVDPLRQAAKEVVARDSLDERVDKVEAYDILSDVAPTTDEALEYLSKARKLATAEGESPAAWLIDELEIRLLRQELDKFIQLMKEIQSRYMKEPGISQSLLEVLSRYGMVTPDGRLRVPAPSEGAGAPEPQPPASSGVWTPDGESATTADSTEEKQESKIWMPGME